MTRMNFLSHHKTVLLIALGVAVGIGAWWGLSGSAPSNSLITTQGSSGATIADKSLVDTLLQLRSVSLGGSIFSDPAFMTLKDLGTQIVPEPVGRPNPFAPVPASAPGASEDAKLFAPRRP